MVKYSWLTDEEIEREVNPLCASRGWMMLNINPSQPTCRVLGAWDGGVLVGFEVCQLVPMVGPKWVAPDRRDGVVSREMSARMHQFLEDTHARGWIAVCESPLTERLAIRHGMKKLESPVYIAVGG